jgi:hypothetical protein
MADESKTEKDEAKSAKEENPAELSDEQMEEASAGYKVVLEDVIISSFQTGGGSGGDAQVQKLSEKVELNDRDIDDIGLKRG